MAVKERSRVNGACGDIGRAVETDDPEID